MPIEESLNLSAVGRRAVKSACSEKRFTEATHPLGGAVSHPVSLTGFNTNDLLARAAEAVPAWQRDVGQKLVPAQGASIERQTILNALTRLGRYGVIVDEVGAIVQGNAGWTQHIAAIATLSVRRELLVPTSPQSHKEFMAGLQLLFADPSLTSLPVALRDLDGWVTDTIHLQRVGSANPNRAYALLPKSLVDVDQTLASLSLALGLTPLDHTLVKLIVKGESDRQMAANLNLKQSEYKRAIVELVAKFRVRQKNDIIRIMASFP